MSEPLIFIFTYAVKDGHLQDYEKHVPELMDFIGSNEPRTIAMEAYINDEGTEATTVLIQPDADAQVHHMDVAGATLNEGYQFLDFTKLRVEVCGTLNETVMQRLRELESSGVPVSFKGRHLGGVNRFRTVATG